MKKSFAIVLACASLTAGLVVAQPLQAPLNQIAPSGASITPQQAWTKVKSGALLVDVRSPAEYSAGHFENAINIPYDLVSSHLAQIGADKAREIVLHCKSGRRAGLAQQELARLGYTHVYNAGGYEDMLSARPR